MQKYDAALKSVPRRGSSGFLSGLMGLDVATFLNVDLPDPPSLRPDLLGEAQDRTLFHVELQSSNDARMAFRMLDYLVAIEREYGCVPRQLVLYVGAAAMKMESRIVAGGLSFEVRMVDIRSLDGERLMKAPAWMRISLAYGRGSRMCGGRSTEFWGRSPPVTRSGERKRCRRLKKRAFI